MEVSESSLALLIFMPGKLVKTHMSPEYSIHFLPIVYQTQSWEAQRAVRMSEDEIYIETDFPNYF